MLFSTPEINELNQKCYDHKADLWLRFPFETLLKKWVKQYAVPDAGSARTLDIGAGNGVLAEWLNQNGFDVLCLDPSPEMLRRCQEKGLATAQGTIQEFQTQEIFSSAFAILSLIHVPKAELPAALEKIASHLSPEAPFFVALIEGSAEEIKEQETGYPRFFATFSKDEALAYFSPRFTLIDYSYSPTTRTSTPCHVFALRKQTF